MGWLTGWIYRKEVTLVEQSSGAYSDYPTIITAAYNAHMKSDFADCRFTESDGTTLIDYGIVEKTDDVSCAFVIKRDYTSGVTLTVYLYYGNAGAADASVDHGPWALAWYLANGFGQSSSAPYGNCSVYRYSASEVIPAWADVIFGGCTANGGYRSYGGRVKINGVAVEWASLDMCNGIGDAMWLKWLKYRCTVQQYEHASFVAGASNTVEWGHNSAGNTGFWVSYYPTDPSVSFGSEKAQEAVDFTAKFEVGQDSVVLLAEFEVRQGSVDLFGEFVVKHVGTPVELPGEFIVRHVGIPVNLPGEFIVRHVGTPVNLPGEFIVKQWQEDLPGEFVVRYEASVDLHAVFDAQTSIDLLGGLIIRHSGPIPWLDGWHYRKTHTLTGSTAGAQTNYPVGVKVYYGAGTDGTEVVDGVTFGKVYCDSKCNTDFSDIRFTNWDGTTLLGYWLQEKSDSDYALFWVEIDSIPVSPDTATIYVYYGNSGATTISDGDAIFTFFDDFTRDRGWTIGNPTFIQILDDEDCLWIDYRRPASNLYCYRPVSGLADGFELWIDSWYDITPGVDDWVTGYFNLSENTDGSRHSESEIYGIRGWGQASGNKHGLLYWNGVALVGKQDGDADPNDDRFIYRISKHDTRLEYYCSSVNVADGVDAVSAGIPDINYIKAWITDSQAGTVDDDCRKKIYQIWIRKWVYPEPAHTAWGPETVPILFAKFEVGQDSIDFLARFEVGQDAEELLGITVSRHQAIAELDSKFLIRRKSTSDLLAKIEDVMHWADLKALFLIPRAYDFSSGMGISFDWWGSGGVDQNIDFEMWSLTGGWIGRFPDGPAEWRQVQLSWDDLTEVDLDGTRPDSSQIIGIYWTYHTSGIRRIDGIRAWMRQDLLCNVVIRNASASDLLSWFKAQATAELLGKGVVKNIGSADLLGRAEVGQGFNDLKAEFCVDMVILPGGLWDYQYVWQNLAAELEVGVQQGQIEIDPATGAITARQRHAINDRSIITMCGGYRAYSKGTFIFDAEASVYSGANPIYTPAFGLVENKYDWWTGGDAHAAMLYSDGAGNWYFYTEDDGDTESTGIAGIDFTTQHTFKIIWEDASEYPATGRVRLYIDDVLKATHATAVPTHPLLFFLLMDSYIVAYSAADVWTKLHSFTVTGDT